MKFEDSRDPGLCPGRRLTWVAHSRPGAAVGDGHRPRASGGLPRSPTCSPGSGPTTCSGWCGSMSTRLGWHRSSATGGWKVTSSDRRLPQGRGIDEGPRLMTGRGTAHDRKAPAHGRKGQDHASGGPASIWLLASPRLDRVNWSTALRSELRPGLARHQAGVVALDGLLVWGLAVAHSLSGDQEASRPWR